GVPQARLRAHANRQRRRHRHQGAAADRERSRQTADLVRRDDVPLPRRGGARADQEGAREEGGEKVTPFIILTGALLLAAAPVIAQPDADPATAVAAATRAEAEMAGQARAVTRSAIDSVFGSGQGGAPAAPA